ncbi:MAG: serine/threonine protein kinase, partial [Myxococcaceae bacterium]
VFWRRASARITDDGHAHAKAGALPPNTDATLGVAALASEAKGATTLDVRFVPGAEPVHAHAGYWRLGDGTLRATQAGDDTGGKPLLAPRAYVGKRYFSSDQLAVEIQLSLRPLEADFPVEAGAQRFGELSFRVKDLQISVLAIPDVGMRMGWRYFRKDGRLVVGNSSADVAEGYEEEAPFPGFNKPFQVRLGLKRVVDGVEVEGQINGAVFFRRQLPGLEGQSAKIALGCRNLHCDFNSLRVRGLASKRGLGNPR